MVASIPAQGFTPFALVHTGRASLGVIAVAAGMLDPAVEADARRRTADEFREQLRKARARGVCVCAEAWVVEGGLSTLLANSPEENAASGAAVLVLIEHNEIDGGRTFALRADRNPDGVTFAPLAAHADTRWTSGLGGWLPSADLWGAP